MSQKRLFLWLASPVIAVLGILMLLRSTRILGWEAGQTWDDASDGHEDVAQPSAGWWGYVARLNPVRVWRAFMEARLFLAQRESSGAPEWMDLPGRDPVELAQTFRELALVNRLLGGTWLTIRGIERLRRDHQLGERFTLLDVASGAADIPCEISAWARRRGLNASVVATDINPEILTFAKHPGSPDALELVTADARCLPFADDAFDIVACSLVLHHLDPDDVVRTLREMGRVASSGVLINDLIRGWTSYIGAWSLSRILTRNQISRHDAPLSARRAYTRQELIDLCVTAGLEPAVTHGFFGYRVVMIAAPSVSQFAVRQTVAPVSTVAVANSD